jgi:flagellar biosynthesis activator protein FlaF
MSSAAQAYARVANTTSSPRDIEAQALLLAANKLQAVMNNVDATYTQMSEALMFNRKLWTIFLSEAQREENPNSLDVRQNIANLGVFVLSQTAALQMSPQREHIKPLIEINRNIAAGLSGRG